MYNRTSTVDTLAEALREELEEIRFRPTPAGLAALRATRTVILEPDALGRWGTACPHGHKEAWPSHRVARIAKGHPDEWCADCYRECHDPRVVG